MYSCRNEPQEALLKLAIRVLILCLFVSSPGGAQTQDTLYTDRPLFTSGDAWLAGGFVAASAIAAPLDEWMMKELQVESRQANRFLQKTATAARVWGNPGTLVAGGGLYLMGTATGNRRMQDLGLHSSGAVILANVVTVGMKMVAGRTRPYVDSTDARDFQLLRGLRDGDYRSFPSGHSTAAFAFASVVTAETSHWWPGARWPVGILTYGTAALTGASRIYNHDHWATDVVVGAAVGTITGLKLFRYQHSHPDNRIDNTFLRAGLQSTGGKWNVLLSVAPR